MAQVRASRTPSKAATASSACSSDVRQLPLVNCPYCGKWIIRRQSKQPATLGAYFFKCEDNVQGDPTSCSFYKWENDYRKWLMSTCREDVDGPQCDTREFQQLKHDIGQLKQIVTELKMEIVALRTKSPKPFVIVDSACVLSLVIGCMFGIVVAMYLD
ncbi:hypothetical protein GQ55_3G381800 [Panicum hallii var. hallii]|uniref:Zinc finger GRF-type domain-containing protein n=1 Tax=Panicum hallii var. hallii TaxID=1504633 RepID=A0A2T7EGC4_9POAL|nr:hypothetical protein GQ55_3G381800 [Panicum hallii var. hallii]